MFTWKDIKATWEDKVTYGLDAKEKTIGVLQVVGQSVISVGTVIGKEVVNTGKSHAKLRSLSDDELRNYDKNHREDYRHEKFQENESEHSRQMKQKRNDQKTEERSRDKRIAKMILEERERKRNPE